MCLCVRVCVFAFMCVASLCVMNSHRDSRAVVKGVSSLAHHTSHSHFQTEEAPERRRDALWSSSDKTSCCSTSSYYTLIGPVRFRAFGATRTHKGKVCAAGIYFSKDWYLCLTGPVLIHYLLHKNNVFQEIQTQHLKKANVPVLHQHVDLRVRSGRIL